MSYILVIIAGISWGLIGLFTKRIDALGFTEMQMLFVKALIGTIFMVFVLLIKDRKSFRLKKWTDIWYFIGSGILSFTFFSWCYMKTINLSSVSMAVVLLYTAPTMVMIASLFLFGERMTKRKGVVLLMTLCGCALVTGLLESGVTVTGRAIFVGLGAGVGYALYSIFGTLALKKGYGSLTISFYTFLMATVFMVFCVDPIAVVADIQAKAQWPLTISFALLTMVLPYLCYTKGLSGIPASRASVTASIEPVVAALLGIVVLHETSTPPKIAGILLVVGAVVLMNTGVKEGKDVKAEKEETTENPSA